MDDINFKIIEDFLVKHRGKLKDDTLTDVVNESELCLNELKKYVFYLLNGHDNLIHNNVKVVLRNKKYIKYASVCFYDKDSKDRFYNISTNFDITSNNKLSVNIRLDFNNMQVPETDSRRKDASKFLITLIKHNQNIKYYEISNNTINQDTKPLTHKEAISSFENNITKNPSYKCAPGVLINDICSKSPSDAFANLKSSFDSLVTGYYSMREILEETNAKKSVKKELEELIKHNKQIILTGAPGTGKTYSAKEFADENSKAPYNYQFVQFHPSYDYSDFVEGLRPATVMSSSNKNEFSFFRLDGVFKAFCREVIKDNYNQAKKDKNAFDIDCAKWKNGKDENDISKFYAAYKEIDETNLPPRFFIIDEINRADLSKVFGELMYCLEDSYRGLVTSDGKYNLIQTQYKNLKAYEINEKGYAERLKFDVFEGGFFIPKNIYIIGTMNDIDRSVEAFDFALRRRFTWIDIEANKYLFLGIKTICDKKGLKITDDVINDLTNRIKEMNKIISDNKYHLSKAFHIGHAYFKNYNGTNEYDIFLENIAPILREYTRGMSTEIQEDLVQRCGEVIADKNLNQ